MENPLHHFELHPIVPIHLGSLDLSLNKGIFPPRKLSGIIRPKSRLASVTVGKIKTGSFSGSAFVPKDFGGTFYITVHGTKGTLYLDMEIKRERLLIRLNDGNEIRDEIKESMISSAQAAGAGNLPGEVARMIKDLTEPKMNWREILRQQIQSTIKNDFTFMRPSRKGWHMNAILPGQNFDETIDICVAVDMSGSIGNQQAEDFLGEVQGIMDEYQDYNIKLWCFDTAVYNEAEFSADGGERLEEYEIIGGGGTEFDCNWEYMKEHNIQPKKFIMFTDGYPWGSWGDEDYCETVFVIHSNFDRKLQAPFGITTHYEDAA